MPVANINGINLNYEISGRGPAVVFLHGGNGRAQDWVNQFPVLSSEYTAIALDIRGHGKSEGPKTEAEYSIPLILATGIGVSFYPGSLNAYLIIFFPPGGYQAHYL